MRRCNFFTSLSQRCVVFTFSEVVDLRKVKIPMTRFTLVQGDHNPRNGKKKTRKFYEFESFFSCFV